MIILAVTRHLFKSPLTHSVARQDVRTFLSKVTIGTPRKPKGFDVNEFNNIYNYKHAAKHSLVTHSFMKYVWIGTASGSAFSAYFKDSSNKVVLSLVLSAAFCWGFMIFLGSLYSNNLIGKIYVHKDDRNKIVLSFLNGKGKRLNLVTNANKLMIKDPESTIYTKNLKIIQLEDPKVELKLNINEKYITSNET